MSQFPSELSLPFLSLRDLQARSKDIASFNETDLVGIAHPVLPSGGLVKAEDFREHIKSHQFESLRRFQGLPATMDLPQTENFTTESIMACGSSEFCGYSTMLTSIGKDLGKGLLVKEDSLQHDVESPASLEVKSFEASPASVEVLQSPAAVFQSDPNPNQYGLLRSTTCLPPYPLSKALTSESPSKVRRPRISALIKQKSKQPVIAAKNSVRARKSHKIHVISPPSSPKFEPLSAPLIPSFREIREISPSGQIGVAPSSAPAHYIEPERGAFSCLLDLADEDGLDSLTFWNLFVTCQTCDRVMLGRGMKEHHCEARASHSREGRAATLDVD